MSITAMKFQRKLWRIAVVATFFVVVLSYPIERFRFLHFGSRIPVQSEGKIYPVKAGSQTVYLTRHDADFLLDTRQWIFFYLFGLTTVALALNGLSKSRGQV